MFSDTYARVKTNSEIEYHFQHMQRCYAYAHVLFPVPPPLSLPILLPWLVFRVYVWGGIKGCGRCMGKCYEAGYAMAISTPRENSFNRMPEPPSPEREANRKAVDSLARLHMEQYNERKASTEHQTVEQQMKDVEKELRGVSEKLLQEKRGGRGSTHAARLSHETAAPASGSARPSLPPGGAPAESPDLKQLRTSLSTVQNKIDHMQVKLEALDPTAMDRKLSAIEKQFGALDRLAEQVSKLTELVSAPASCATALGAGSAPPTLRSTAEDPAPIEFAEPNEPLSAPATSRSSSLPRGGTVAMRCAPRAMCCALLRLLIRVATAQAIDVRQRAVALWQTMTWNRAGRLRS